MNTTIHTDWAPPLTQDIGYAQHSIYITVLSMHTPRHSTDSKYCKLFENLKAAIKRGLIVHVALPAASKTHGATLMNTGTLNELASIGATVHSIPMPNLLHAKTVLIDENIVWIGSGNWTAAAAHHNHEIYNRTESHYIARVLAKHWEELIKTNCDLTNKPW